MRLLLQLASLLALLRTVTASEALPYNPTRIFVLQNSTDAYIFQPSSQSAGQAQLLSFDFSDPFTTSSDTFLTVSDTLPFLQDNELLAYTPVIDSAGNITVVTGNCSAGVNGTEVWRFVRDSSSSLGNGSWTEYQTTDSGIGSDGTLAGPNFLASGIAFSEDVQEKAANTDFFVFGGMCPYANSTTDTWTDAANYSNLMLSLSPETSNADFHDYDLTIATANGPPIAEAGFSITSLTPSYSDNSSGQTQTQSQDFVLLGGHTRSAFINMSQVALFSLPEEGWTFLPVAQPSSAKTDLTVRSSTSEVEPRSGHTAILSEDGTSVIVFGGWVGDVSTPAQPQLAVLSLGSAYGGSGDWSWSIPTPSGNGPASGAGLYGHGAAMLPGGVMMIVGGYSIPASSSKRVKRDAQTANAQTYLYNTTSNTWVDSYTPPVSSSQGTNQASGASSDKSKKVGLGAGLGVGAAILISVSIFYFWYSRRLGRARQHRERMLLSRSSDGSFGQMDQPFLKKGSIDGRGGDTAAVGRFWNVWDHDAGSYPPRPAMQEQSAAAGSTGLFVNLPSPTRGLRKGSTAARNYQYHAAPRYDDKRVSRGSGNIHTITEHDEEDGQEGAVVGSDHDGLTDAERKLKEVERVLSAFDPFTDAQPNPLRSHPVSPEPPSGDTVRRVPTGASRMSVPPARQTTIAEHGEQPNWTVEPEPVVRDNTGRVSPSKSSSDDRTSSTLSERSQRSNLSTNSTTQTASTRAGNLLFAAAAARFANNSSVDNSPIDERAHTMSTDGGRKSPFSFNNRARASTNGSVQVGAPLSACSDAESFTTAKSGFAQLQSEGELLLGGRPTLDRDDPYQRALAAHSSTADTMAPLFGSSDRTPAIPPRRRQGWMGSLRRAINAVAVGDRSVSLTGTREQYTDQQRASSNSPTKDRREGIGHAPRRAISDGGALLRKKRGQKDWEEPVTWTPYHDDPDWGEQPKSLEEKGQADAEASEDWDVEGAASKRDVQVMFTIPKTRLRVVNATDFDRMSVRSASEGGVPSRSGSLKSTILRSQESVKTLRAKSDADTASLLPATAEEHFEDAVEGPSEMWQHEKEKSA